jgi:hypothetical protein
MTATTANLMDHLQEQGYEPQDDGTQCSDWYDLIISGIGSVRVVIWPGDGYRAEVYAFDGYMACEWDAKFSPGTPDAAIIGVIEAAEWQLAATRGGPVTPAQVQARNA